MENKNKINLNYFKIKYNNLLNKYNSLKENKNQLKNEIIEKDLIICQLKEQISEKNIIFNEKNFNEEIDNNNQIDKLTKDIKILKNSFQSEKNRFFLEIAELENKINEKDNLIK